MRVKVTELAIDELPEKALHETILNKGDQFARDDFGTSYPQRFIVDCPNDSDVDIYASPQECEDDEIIAAGEAAREMQLEPGEDVLKMITDERNRRTLLIVQHIGQNLTGPKVITPETLRKF